MKLSDDIIAYIQTVVRTAKTVGIDNIIIEPDMVRAIDEAKTVVIFQDKDVPIMPFGSIGLNRIEVFTSRHEIARTQDNFSMEAVVDEGKGYTKSLTMKAKGMKIDYRCANPMTIQAPKQVRDTLKYNITVAAEDVVLLQKGQSAMGAENVSIISNKNGVSFELVDINNDVFSHTVADEVKCLTEDSNTLFAFKYPIKTLLSLFKHNTTFSVGQKGILNVVVNDLNLFVLPQV